MKAMAVANDTGRVVGYLVRCPACDAADRGSVHQFSVRMNDGSPGWSFNGDFESPTFLPSMCATARQAGVEHRCHSFVRDGRIEYLSDCTHAMAGNTIDLPDFEDQ